MKRVPLLLILGAIFCSVPAFALAEAALPISKPAVSEQITGVIAAQLAAFRAGEVEKAYSYAAEPLRLQTPAPAFARIVQQSYPEIWRNTRADFGLVRDDGKRATLVVRVFAEGADAAYDYVLFKEAAGWRIGGVLRHEPSAAKSL
ncbi:MAG: DUF4864 domain-containing protein [Opitutaceae bacterium]